METFWDVIKSEAASCSAKEWAAIVAGVVVFIILTGIC